MHSIPGLFEELPPNMRRPSKRSGKSVKSDDSLEHAVVVADVDRPLQTTHRNRTRRSMLLVSALQQVAGAEKTGGFRYTGRLRVCRNESASDDVSVLDAVFW